MWLVQLVDWIFNFIYFQLVLSMNSHLGPKTTGLNGKRECVLYGQCIYWMNNHNWYNWKKSIVKTSLIWSNWVKTKKLVKSGKCWLFKIIAFWQSKHVLNVFPSGIIYTQKSKWHLYCLIVHRKVFPMTLYILFDYDFHEYWVLRCF